MKNIIRQILKEDRRQMYLDKIVHIMKNDFPLLKNMELYGFRDQLSNEEMGYVFSGIFGEPVEYYYGGNVPNIIQIYDENNKRIYNENSYGGWVKSEYDENGNRIYSENSDGYWYKREYDENRNLIYFENSYGLIRDYR